MEVHMTQPTSARPARKRAPSKAATATATVAKATPAKVTVPEQHGGLDDAQPSKPLVVLLTKVDTTKSYTKWAALDANGQPLPGFTGVGYFPLDATEIAVKVTF